MFHTDLRMGAENTRNSLVLQTPSAVRAEKWPVPGRLPRHDL
jgi:hypothetical protein